MPRRRQASGEGRESEETRHLILHTARRLFLSEGYHAVSTRQITDACDLTHPALYHYFAGKEELYVAMLLEEIARLQAVLERVARRAEQSVVERLRQVALFLLTTTDYDFSVMQHDIRSELGERAREILERAFLGGVIEPLVHIFSEGQRQGQIRDFGREGLSTAGLATLFLSMIVHFLTSRMPATPESMRGTVSVMATTELIMHVFLQGVTEPSQLLLLADKEADEVS